MEGGKKTPDPFHLADEQGRERAKEAASHAVRTLQPGSGSCPMCGGAVWRYQTSGNMVGFTLFDEVDCGMFDWPDVHSEHPHRVRLVGGNAGSLSPHVCVSRR